MRVYTMCGMVAWVCNVYASYVIDVCMTLSLAVRRDSGASGVVVMSPSCTYIHEE